MKVRAILLAVALAACSPAGQNGPEAPQAPTPETLDAELERYGVMLTQVENLTVARPGAAEIVATEIPALSRALRERVWELNTTRSQLCSRGLFTDVSCRAPYDPVWMAEPPEAQPTVEELKVRADAVGAEVTAFWEAVCADARARAATDQDRARVCAID